MILVAPYYNIIILFQQLKKHNSWNIVVDVPEKNSCLRTILIPIYFRNEFPTGTMRTFETNFALAFLATNFLFALALMQMKLQFASSILLQHLPC